MTVKDILTVTGGRTKVILFTLDEYNHGMIPWAGIVDDINFEHVPYGSCEVYRMTVVTDEDVLQLHFKCPKLTKQEIAIANEEAVGYAYPTEWVDRLFIKYRDWDYVRKLLASKNSRELYKEIRLISREEAMQILIKPCKILLKSVQ